MTRTFHKFHQHQQKSKVLSRRKKAPKENNWKQTAKQPSTNNQAKVLRNLKTYCQKKEKSILKILNKMTKKNDKYAEVLHQEVKWLRMEDIEEYHDTILLRTKMGDMGKYYIIFQSYSRICNSLLTYLPTFEIHKWTKNRLVSYKAASVANASFFSLESAGKSRKHQQQPTKVQK